MTDIAAIAKAAGVSPTAALRFLRDDHIPRRRDAALRAERVRAVAMRLGWRPNLAASAMRTGRFGAVTLVSGRGPATSNLNPSLLDGLSSALEDAGLNLLFQRLADDRLADAEALPRLLRTDGCDGFLVSYHGSNRERLAQHLATIDKPTVWINDDRTHDCVHPDDRAAGTLAAERLLALGRRRIAYAHFTSTSHRSLPQRGEGLGAGLHAAGLHAALLGPPAGVPVNQFDRIAWARRWLTGDQRPDGMLCYHTDAANAVVIAAGMLGVRIPEDLAVVVVADGQTYAPTGMLYTTIAMPFQEVGAQAVAALQRRLAGGGAEPAIAIAPRLIDGASAPAP